MTKKIERRGLNWEQDWECFSHHSNKDKECQLCAVEICCILSKHGEM